MAKPALLLKAGQVLVHCEGPRHHVSVLPETDVLIENGLIKQIGMAIDPPKDVHLEVIDCRGKIVSPGFISTHHHLWQTQLKGRHANHSLLQYMYTGKMAL